MAALSVRTRRGGGSGSAVTFTDDGFLLTSAHVVAGSDGGTAAFADGTETTFDVVGVRLIDDVIQTDAAINPGNSGGAERPGPAAADARAGDRRPPPITVLRRDALVDVVAVPAKLS